MSCLAGDKQQTNGINKTDGNPGCGTGVLGLKEEKGKDTTAGLTDFKTELIKNEVPKTNSLCDSYNRNETCEFQLMQTEENWKHLHPKIFLLSQDTFTWKIENFLNLPANKDYCIDSKEFSFANTTWCLRIYPNGKKGNHEGWVHLLLVQLQSSNSRHQIYYRLVLKVEDKDLHESLTHLITLNSNIAEVGIINPLQRSDINNSLNKHAQNSFLVAFCEIKEVELSKSVDAFETSKYESEELAKHNQDLSLPLTVSYKDVFIWEIRKFFELPMNEGFFLDSETFSIANAVWCLRIYPNGQEDMNQGWIDLLLIRLYPPSSQQCIQYRLGLKMKGNKEYGTLTHAVTFHANAKEAGVVNLIKRSDIVSMKKKFARNGVLRVFCQVSSSTVDLTNKSLELGPPSEISLVKKLKDFGVGVLEKIPFVSAKDVIWKIPSFVIEPMQVGYWMDSPSFSFLNENWCLRLYMKEKKFGKDWKICMYLVRFNTCSFMYLISYELSILDRCGSWLKFKKRNCQGIYQSHVMKLGISKLHFSPDGFVMLYFQILSKEELAEASVLEDKPKYHLEFPLNDVELFGPSLFQHGMLFHRSFLAAMEVIWKIPDFFELRKTVVDSINSPIFEFGRDTWLLQLYPNGFEKGPERISFILSRLFTSVTKRHIIYHFSVRNSNYTISRCKMEEVFEGTSKSLPVNLELSKIIQNLKTNVPDGILTVFCQIYIVQENDNTEHLQPITRDPLNAMNQFRYGLLFQQSFSAVTDIIWKIPNFLTFKKDHYINSPAFNLANDSWLLQLYPKGYETSAEKMSLILVRLFPSNINHHVICKFSVKSTNNVVHEKGSFESNFINKMVQSSPIHLKKNKNRKKQEENDSNDLLTVFCQMYIIEDKKAAVETSSELTQSKKMEEFQLDDTKQFIHGTLVQQLFLAATEVVWKIPDFHSLIKKQDNFINSPVFGIDNDTWLVQLYLKGDGKTIKKIYCILVRLFKSNLERHVIWKISIKNKKNMIIESGTCESTFRKKLLKSCPINLQPNKVMDNVRENLPQDLLMLFCQVYIIDDNRETVIKPSSQINQPRSITSEDSCAGVVVVPNENENKSQFQNNAQDLTSKEENVVENEKDINKIFDELDFTRLKKKKKKKKKNMFDPLEAEHALSEKKKEENVARNEDPCLEDIVVLKENENKSHSLKGFHNNSEDLSSKEGNVLEDGKEVNIDLEELDFTHLKKKKKKKKKAMNNQLEAEHSFPEKEKETNIARNKDLYELDFIHLKKKKNAMINQLEAEHPILEKEKETNIARSTGDMVMLEENENKSCFSKAFQKNSQETAVKGNGCASVDIFIVYDADLTEDKINNSQLVVEYPDTEKNGVIELVKDIDLNLGTAVSLEQDGNNIPLSENLKLDHKVKGAEKDDPKEKFNVGVDDFSALNKEIMNNDEQFEHLKKETDEEKVERTVGKIHQDYEEVPLYEKDYVKFLIRGEEIRAHLSAFKEQSSFFASVIQHDIMKVSNTIIIEDCDPQLFKIFLLYLYTGQVDVLTSENVYGLYSLASKYGIHKLKIECLEYMKSTISVDTVCDIMSFSLQQKENDILELTTAFFLSNETEIASTAKWQMFLKKNYMFANQLLETVLKK